MQLEFKKTLAKTLAGIAPDSAAEIGADITDYMARVFRPDNNDT
jgi:4-hydroxybutyryl-CoA dehydratase/vinylacetyl-CoA-Delta-isomerase